eukprot:CAMPEP_0167757404 /NCGR_PEP_ID=MMETSP0110_2-20121227/9907_1 /TAXON_ID=629695 /ORGANISM="Gymnochlora sp., Strain CCMP2014" /LENGTH=348 /DNA_ID=CAMNT_0007643591 /DNA_START=275 /DNA_END=1321 /DNA_ORIENTATION=+
MPEDQRRVFQQMADQDKFRYRQEKDQYDNMLRATLNSDELEAQGGEPSRQLPAALPASLPPPISQNPQGAMSSHGYPQSLNIPAAMAQTMPLSVHQQALPQIPQSISQTMSIMQSNSQGALYNQYSKLGKDISRDQKGVVQNLHGMANGIQNGLQNRDLSNPVSGIAYPPQMMRMAPQGVGHSSAVPSNVDPLDTKVNGLKMSYAVGPESSARIEGGKGQQRPVSHPVSGMDKKGGIIHDERYRGLTYRNPQAFAIPSNAKQPAAKFRRVDTPAEIKSKMREGKVAGNERVSLDAKHSPSVTGLQMQHRTNSGTGLNRVGSGNALFLLPSRQDPFPRTPSYPMIQLDI